MENCTFVGTDVGIRFKSALGRGGVVEEIDIKDIYMTDIVNEAIIFTMGYVLTNSDGSTDLNPEDVPREDVPEFKNVRMKNINCVGAKQAIKIEGLKQLPIHDLSVEDSYFKAEIGYTESYAENIVLNNVVIDAD